ncbi:MAG TPA: N-acetylmuramoyl-L-alanine amidase [Solirubrobacteraceae bacterium]
MSHGRRTIRRAYLLGAAILALAAAWALSHHGSSTAARPAGTHSSNAGAIPLATPAAQSLPATAQATPARPAATQPAPAATGAATSPLAGRIVTVDPGHNGGNFTHPRQIARLVPDGNGEKECDTTGTAAPDGYRETDFNWSVAQRLRALLAAAGAHVVLTRSSNTGVGPCVNERAGIGNRAHSDVAISIHADGGPPGGSGFAVLVPAPVPGGDRAIVSSSRHFALDVRAALLAIGLHTSTYDGSGGLAARTDLGGLNLSTRPKVFVEVGNMQNRPDEAPMESAAYRERVARALLAAIERFLPPR